MGVPVLVILDARTGHTVTTTARKDLKKNVTEVYTTWDKLLALRMQQAVERAAQDAISQAQRAEKEWRDKLRKLEAEKNANNLETGLVQAEIV